jgi:hypothetical protein
MKQQVKRLNLTKPQKELLRRQYRVGSGVLALHSAWDHVTVLQVYVDRCGVLRLTRNDALLLPLSLLDEVGNPALPHRLPVTETVGMEEARAQALAICRSAERHLAEIEAIRRYRAEVVRVVLQREATGWSFRAVHDNGSGMSLEITPPEGGVWRLERDAQGAWTTVAGQEQARFEQTWGASLREAWQQRLLDAAAMIVGSVEALER